MGDGVGVVGGVDVGGGVVGVSVGGSVGVVVGGVVGSVGAVVGGVVGSVVGSDVVGAGSGWITVTGSPSTARPRVVPEPASPPVSVDTGSPEIASNAVIEPIATANVATAARPTVRHVGWPRVGSAATVGRLSGRLSSVVDGVEHRGCVGRSGRGTDWEPDDGTDAIRGPAEPVRVHRGPDRADHAAGRSAGEGAGDAEP